MVSVGLAPIPVSDVTEVLATLLGPGQLGALLHMSEARTANFWRDTPRRGAVCLRR
jgi:hypothetical protein